MKRIIILAIILFSIIKADDICINKTISSVKWIFSIPPFKYTKGVEVKANSNIKDINVTIAERDLQPFFEDYSPIKFNKLEIDGIPKSDANDNPDHYCTTSMFGGKSCVDDPDYRAASIDDLKLNDIFPFPGVPGFSAVTDGSLYNINQMDINDTHELTKEMDGISTLVNFFTDHALFLSNFFNTSVVTASYVKDGKLYKNVILNPCGDTVPEVSVNDSSIESPEQNTVMSFNVIIDGNISGDIAKATDNKSYIHYKTVDGSAKAGIDYVATDGVLVVNKGQHTAEINVTVKANANPGNFYLILDNAYGARILDGNATGTILPPSPSDETLPDEDVRYENGICGTFEDMFQTYDNDCKNSNSKIYFDNGGQLLDNTKYIIENNKDNKLNSCNVSAKTWVKNQFETCGEKGDCEKVEEPYSINLDINYTNPPQTAVIEESPSQSEYNIIGFKNNLNLKGYSYNKITENTGYSGLNIIFNIINKLKINDIEITSNNKVLFNSENPYNLEIGYLKYNSDGSGNNVTVTNAKNIKIYNLNLKSNTTMNLEAVQTIKINNFTIGNGGSDIILKAPYVDINNFNIYNDGSGNCKVKIIANYIDLGNVNLGQNIELTVMPYTAGKTILFRSNAVSESSSSTMLLDSGKYYFGNWSVPGTSNNVAVRALNSNSNIQLFVNNSIDMGNNPGINTNGNRGDFNDTLSAAKFIIFVNGNFKTGGGGTTINAGMVVKGNVDLGNPTYIKGAVLAKNITVGQGQFIYDNAFYNGEWGVCRNNSFTIITGLFDAWDITGNINNRNIITKTVAKPFTIKVVSLNSSNNKLETKQNIDVKYGLISNDDNTTISDLRDFNASINKSINATYNITRAYKDVSVVFKVCADYNGSEYILKPYNTCSAECVSNTVTDNTCIREFKSSDDFAIRPDHFNITNIPSIVKAGNDFNLTIQALDYTGNPAADYNETISKTTSPVISALDYNVSSGCQTGELVLVNNMNFQNGETNLTLKYKKQAGDVNFTIREIEGNEFAAVDSDDTPWSLREITPMSVSVKVVPDHFNINASYHDFNNSNFTYISSDLNMSSYLDLNITAKDKDDNNITNYNTQCYAKNFDLNITHNTPSVFDSNHLILFKDENGAEQNVTISNNINLANLPKTYFVTGDHNGTAQFKIYINFDKNYTNPVNEFNFTINDINISDTDDINGGLPLDENVTFRYGRIKVSNVAGYGNDLNTTVEYQYWLTSQGWVTNNDHTRDVFGKIYRDETVFSPSGDVNVSLGNINNGTQSLEFNTTHSLPYGVKVHLSIDSWMWYNPLASDYQKPEQNLSCKTHPCMKVDFLGYGNGKPGVSAIDDAKYDINNRTTEVNASINTGSNSSDINITKSQVKKINW